MLDIHQIPGSPSARGASSTFSRLFVLPCREAIFQARTTTVTGNSGEHSKSVAARAFFGHL